MEQEKDEVILHLKNKVVIITSQGFDSEIDIDDLLQLDHTNLYAELITIPVLINKIGLLKAESIAIYERKKMDFSILEAKLSEYYRVKAKESEIKPTEKWLEEKVTLDKSWVIEKRNLIEAQKNVDFMWGLWQSVLSKDNSLKTATRNIIPSEHENSLIEQKINTVMIKVRDKKFKEV